jgi:hypothetical protein
MMMIRVILLRALKGPEGRIASSAACLLLVGLLVACSGPMTVTEYVGGMETGSETVVYDSKGHPEITSESGYVADPYAESYTMPKEDFMRDERGVVPD